MIIFLYNTIDTEEYKYLELLYKCKLYKEYKLGDNIGESILYILYYLDKKDLFLIGSNNKYNKTYEDRKKEGTLLNYNIIRLLKLKNAKILFFNDWETKNIIENKYNKNIELFISSYNIDKNKVILSSNDFLHIKKIYKNNYTIISYDWVYLKKKYNFNLNKKSNLNIDKKKYGIFLNRRNNEERLAMAIYLYNAYNKLLIMSYLDPNKKNTNSWLEKYIPYEKIKNFNLNINKYDYDNFMQILPLIIDNTNLAVKWNNYDTIYDHLNNSYFMIVFETNMENENYQQISEKTYKPLTYGIPFLVFTKLPGILKYLRKVGFKTFEPYIHEDYDSNIYDYYTRYRLFVKELDRLFSMSKDEIKSLYINCIPIIHHNWEILNNNFIPEIL